jgi:hypothetical protein
MAAAIGQLGQISPAACRAWVAAHCDVDRRRRLRAGLPLTRSSLDPSCEQRVPEETLSVLDGSTFVLSDRRGDLIPGNGREHGFFSDDTRFLSQWALRVDDTPLDLLGLDQEAHFASQFFLTPRVGTDDAAPCSVMRRRCVDRVWLEEITIVSHRLGAATSVVEFDVDSDFADLFEVKAGASPRARFTGAPTATRSCSNTPTRSSSAR